MLPQMKRLRHCRISLALVLSGLSANRKCALSSALFMRVQVPLALK